MTVEYTADARKTVDDYLQAIRNRLGASRLVDADEVLDGISEHLEKELTARSQPVSRTDVAEVLDRLGPPEQIVADEDISWWRKMVLHLRQGPEDWRLAYLSLGVLILGTPISGGLGIIGSFFLSRAAVTLVGEPEPPAKKWLIYPSLIIVYSLIGFFVLLWPAYVAGGLTGELIDRGSARDYGIIVAVLAAGSLALAVWWSFLWVMWRRRPTIFRATFRPFADNWTGRRFGKLVLGVWCLALPLIVGVVLLWT